jgi:redox-sensitive bicupin YhaK (pirin superfamily)
MVATMIVRRPANERGRTKIGWLDSWHSFSFGDYFDPAHVEFRSLRVLNDDKVAAGQGFGMHPHRDMEIITYMVSGALEHKDSLGTGSVIRPGEVQRMSAGTGIRHSEFNPSQTEPAHLLQIWLMPEQRGLTPGYEQKAFPESERRNRWRLVASRDGREGSVTIHQDAAMYVTSLEAGEDATHTLPRGRYAWLQVVRGGVTLNGQPLQSGDGAAVSNESALTVTAQDEAELVLFDLA